MRHSLRNDNSRPRLDHAQHFILRGRRYVRAFAIDCQTVDLIDMTIDNFEDVVAVQWRCRNVPNDDEVVKAGADEDILGRRMPFELSNLATMAEELDGELSEARRQAALWDVPQLDGAVVGS